MIRVAIVDDFREDAAVLEQYLYQFGGETGQAYLVTRYTSGPEVLQDRSTAFDLVILDIDMPGLNGMETARQLRGQGDNVVLMFVTNMSQYALEGYEVEAVDYVLKPVSYQDFTLKLRKAQRYISQNRDTQIALHTTNGIVLLMVSQVIYVESALHYLVYHTTTSDYRVRGSISDAESTLPHGQFSRCNTSFLVNLKYVKALERDEVLMNPDNHRLKISRGRRGTFLDQMGRYLGGVDL